MRRKSKKVKFMKSFRFSGQTGDSYSGQLRPVCSYDEYVTPQRPQQVDNAPKWHANEKLRQNQASLMVMLSALPKPSQEIVEGVGKSPCLDEPADVVPLDGPARGAWKYKGPAARSIEAAEVEADGEKVSR